MLENLWSDWQEEIFEGEAFNWQEEQEFLDKMNNHKTELEKINEEKEMLWDRCKDAVRNATTAYLRDLTTLSELQKVINEIAENGREAMKKLNKRIDELP
jgi:hemoglobin-like flavoprotein